LPFFYIFKALPSRWRSSMAEQLICNQQVGGSSPPASSGCLGTSANRKGFRD
jgi:hypothetical protein